MGIIESLTPPMYSEFPHLLVQPAIKLNLEMLLSVHVDGIQQPS